MKIFIITATLLVVLAGFILPDNFYSAGFLVCNGVDGCRHEIGHKMDDDLGKPSHSAEFGDALRAYILFAGMSRVHDQYTLKILWFGGILQYSPLYDIGRLEMFSSPQSELYADMYMMAGGNVDYLPEIFRQFYSTDHKYTDLHNCLMTKRICSKAWRK